jgi:nucleotide-binding universal stress UspA family protein
MVKHILIAHDLSPEADIALRRAIQLAGQLRARLTLLHVASSQPSPALLARLRSAEERTLATHLQGQPPLDVQLRLEVGPHPAELILQYISLGNCDLLVLGSHHRQPTQGFAGSVQERILEASPIPVLVAVDPAGAPYARALAAIDFSPCASRALRAAWQLLPPGAQLKALHVQEVAAIRAADNPDERAFQQSLFERFIGAEFTALPPRAVQFSHSFQSGERQACLDAALADQAAQLLALGGHSRDALSERLLGSLTRLYLDNPPCDLLVVR